MKNQRWWQNKNCNNDDYRWIFKNDDDVNDDVDDD